MPGASVVARGGFPLAGNLQDEAANASITSNTHVKTIFFFMLFSLTPYSVHPIKWSHDAILLHFMGRITVFSIYWVAINMPN
jgi:hypothetical protein